MTKFNRKLFSIGMCFIVITALISTLAVPALAASSEARVQSLLGTAMDTNFSSVAGTLEVDDNTITITPDDDPSTDLAEPSDTAVTIYYNSSTGVVERLILNGTEAGNYPGQGGDVQNMNNVAGTLEVDDNTITITPDDDPAVDFTEPSDTAMTILYNSSTGIVEGLMLNQGRDVSAQGTNATYPKVTGTLEVDDNTITITPDEDPSVDFTEPSDTDVTIYYNSSTGVIDRLTLGGADQTPPNSGNAQNNNNQGGPSQGNNAQNSNAPGGNGKNGNAQGGNTPGGNFQNGNAQGGNMPNNTPQSGNSQNGAPQNANAQNIENVTGTLEVDDNVITITPDDDPSVDLTEPSSTTITILYDSSTGEIEGLGSNLGSIVSSQATNNDSANVSATIDVDDNTITITPEDDPAVDLTEPSDTAVTIFYNSSTGAVERLMLKGSGQSIPSNGNTPGQNGNSQNNNAQGGPNQGGNAQNGNANSQNGNNQNNNSQNMENVTGTLSIDDNTITITPDDDPTVDLVNPDNTTMTIGYNSSTGAVERLSLNSSGKAVPGAMNTPNQNNNNQNTPAQNNNNQNNNNQNDNNQPNANQNNNNQNSIPVISGIANWFKNIFGGK